MTRTVKKFLSSRLIIKIVGGFGTRTKGTNLLGRGIKGHFESLGNRLSGGFQGVFIPPRTPFVLTEYMPDWEQYRQNVPGVPRHRTV